MSDQERETEEDEGGGTSDTAPMLPQRPPDHQASAPAYAWWPGLATQRLETLLLPGRVLAWLLLHLLLPGTVFLLVLLPAVVVVYLGFLCHSRVSRNLHGRGPWDMEVLHRFRAPGLQVDLPPSTTMPLYPEILVPLPGSNPLLPSTPGCSQRRAFVYYPGESALPSLRPPSPVPGATRAGQPV